jgi:type II secretory pathway component PulF
LHDSIVLAAGCTADRKLIKAADKAAEFLKQGGTFAAGTQPLEGFPPLVAWLISAGGREQTFTALARHVAQSYRRSILRDLDWLRIFLPIWLVVLVGGLVVGLYGATFFLPYSQLLEALAGHVSSSTLRIQP